MSFPLKFLHLRLILDLRICVKTLAEHRKSELETVEKSTTSRIQTNRHMNLFHRRGSLPGPSPELQLENDITG